MCGSWSGRNARHCSRASCAFFEIMLTPHYCCSNSSCLAVKSDKERPALDSSGRWNVTDIAWDCLPLYKRRCLPCCRSHFVPFQFREKGHHKENLGRRSRSSQKRESCLCFGQRKESDIPPKGHRRREQDSQRYLARGLCRQLRQLDHQNAVLVEVVQQPLQRCPLLVKNRRRCLHQSPEPLRVCQDQQGSLLDRRQ